MKIFKQIAPLKEFLKDIRLQGKSTGLVPTMGALHSGHLKLIEASKAQNEVTVASIFVNPTQFNNPEDLQKYPRTLDKDIKMLEEVQCDVLFCPTADEMYPEKSTLTFQFAHLDNVMEGAFRPGHFSGVALVVSKLFNIINPHQAYFGQKDWQQFVVISRLIEELNFNIKLHSIPTLREADGLALSSRNQRLDATQRKQAVFFYRALLASKEALKQGGTFAAVQLQVKSMLSSTNGVTLEYLELADSKNLNAISNVSASVKPILCIAGYVGSVRLIDNMFVD